MKQPPRRRRRRGPTWKLYALALVGTVATGLAVGLAVGGAFDGTFHPGSVDKDPTASESTATRPTGGFNLVPRLRDPLNLLVMACDVEYEVKNGRRVLGLNGNTDSMILMRLDPPQGQIRMLSIPRDTRVPIPGHGTFKINAANPYGGPTLAAQVVSDFLNVKVDRYVLFNTRAVIQIVDALGGINVYVPKNLNYDDWSGKLHIHLHKGQNFLDGQHAHDFLRFRHDELGDIGRVQRNQAFMQAVMAQYLNPVNLLKTPQLMGMAKDNMQTNLANDELMQIVGWGKDLKRENIQFAMVPGSAQDVDRVSYWLPDETATRRIVSSYFLGNPGGEARTPAAYRVAVRDGVGDWGASRTMKRALHTAGYVDVRMDGLASPLGQSETEVIAQQADVAGAKALAQALGVNKVTVAATGNIYTDFTVVVGRDWLHRPVAANRPLRP